MALYTQDRAIKEYYETIKDQYPDLSFDQISEICKAPFIFFKKCIQSGELPRIYIKYIGKLIVRRTRILKQKKIEESKHARGWIDPERYENNMKFYDYYLKELENESKAKDQISTEWESDMD